MIFDLNLIKRLYSGYKSKVDEASALIGRKLTYTEKILYSHLWEKPEKAFERG